MMRTLEAAAVAFPLDRPFRIARGTRTVADVLVVSLRQGAEVGRGEAVPYARYGETMAEALHAIERVRSILEAGADRALLARLLPAGAARNAIDCALWDLEARLAGTSVWAMTGIAPPARLATAVTIGIDTPDAMAAQARTLAEVPLLKVKLDAEAPEARLRAVRAAAPAPRLIVDPNESWTVAMVARLMPFLGAIGCDLLEQPVPAAGDAGLAGIERLVPVCADESVHEPADVARLGDRYSHVNIKLDKAGGLTAALDLLAAARAAGLGVMTGCMVASSLAMAAALPVAAGSDYADLDGPLWLAADRPGGVRIVGGWLHPAAAGFWGEAAASA